MVKVRRTCKILIGLSIAHLALLALIVNRDIESELEMGNANRRHLLGHGSNKYSTCAMREIIKSLNTPDLDMQTVSKAIAWLKHCKSIYFMRIPKCATRTLFELFKDLQKQNNFVLVDWLHKEYPKPGTFEFTNNVTNGFNIPAIHGRENYYVNFSRYGLPPPLYTTIVRHPIDRLVSQYYFQIYGSGENDIHQRGMLELNRHCRNKTIDDIILNPRSFYRRIFNIYNINHPCWPPFPVQYDFFCDPVCWELTKKVPRHITATKIMESEFLLVGLAEDMHSYVKCLEFLLPNYFADLTEHYVYGQQDLGKQFKTASKPKLKPETRQKLETLMKNDIDFYERVKQRFYRLCNMNKTQSHDIL